MSPAGTTPTIAFAIGAFLSFACGSLANAQSLYENFFVDEEDVSDKSISAAESGTDGSSLIETIRAALTHNPQIGVADAEIRAARAGRFRALGQFLPSVQGSARYARDDFRSSTLDTLEDRDGLTLGLTVSQPVFRGLSTFNGFREQRARVRASEFLLDDTQMQVAVLAARAHAAVIFSREVVSHRRENLALVSRQLEITKARMEAGAQSRTGVEQARMRVARAEVALQAARARQSAEEASYERVVGHFPLGLSTRNALLDIDELQSREDALNAAYHNNPALNAARETVSATRFAKRAAYGQFSPNVDIEGNFFRRYGEDLGGPEEDEYQIVARMRVPIFAQGENIAGARLASSEVARQQAQATATQLAVHEVVSRTWSEITAAKARRAAAIESIEAAERSVEGLKVEFEGGRRTVIDVLDGQRDLVETKISLSQAEFDLRAAAYELAGALGAIKHFSDPE